ncbi:MAG: hypothetical protein QOF21_1965 [Actinomycetota bacterium]|jgi:hypothetical protein
MIRRLGLGVLVTLTTLSGIPRVMPIATSEANASRVVASRVSASARTAPRLTNAQITERVFDFGDRLQAVDYQLGFVGEARDAVRTATACQTLLVGHESLRDAIDSVRSRVAREVGADLIRAAATTVDVCSSTPPANDEATAERAYIDFALYRDLAFDFVDLISR